MMPSTNNIQVKSKKRVSDHGEVFTSEREVNDMLDLVKQETQRIDSRFLEPACGSGNFLVEVLNRKLRVVESIFRRSQLEYERNSVLAISSIYGVDILNDNVKECRERLFEIFDSKYSKLYRKKCTEQCRQSIKFILSKNIMLGDALYYTNPETNEPIVFSEWTFITGSLLKRRDFRYRFLVDKSNSSDHVNDLGDFSVIDEPIQEFPVTHFLKIAEYA
ncbi:DNA methyltransferase [Gelidibacter gilvus]|uniref:site-specific DNA-methyltransferase (adenine-specific) n=1 Tax=Gelidibacter gilvus TaxID=59602 RepID=A0A4V1LNG0_9FLAO|nr:DNA methyltransferase [Gelidibacter gilvus]RXJ52640.1 SAM-dependent DNA methyltransferase [Gelidibacter gilvus]